MRNWKHCGTLIFIRCKQYKQQMANQIHFKWAKYLVLICGTVGKVQSELQCIIHVTTHEPVIVTAEECDSARLVGYSQDFMRRIRKGQCQEVTNLSRSGANLLIPSSSRWIVILISCLYCTRLLCWRTIDQVIRGPGFLGIRGKVDFFASNRISGWVIWSKVMSTRIWKRSSCQFMENHT